MKRLRILILIMTYSVCTIFMSMNATYTVQAKSAVEFTDLSYSDWFTQSVSYLVNNGAINGYADNTFRPYNDITREEFIKVLITSLYSEEEIEIGNDMVLDRLDYSTDYWATVYLKKAEATGIIDDYIISQYDYSPIGLKEPITRGEIAYFMMNVEEEVKAYYINDYITFDYDDGYYMYLISDIQDDDAPIAEAEVACYKYGIISGYPDGTYRSGNNASRADAATIIVRYLVESFRVELELDEENMPFNLDDKGVPTIRDTSFQRPVHYAYDDPYVIYMTDESNVKLEMIEQVGVELHEDDSDYMKLFSLKLYGSRLDKLDEYELFLYTGHIRLILAYGTDDVTEIIEFVDETELYLYDTIMDVEAYSIEVSGKDREDYRIDCEVTDDTITYIVYEEID